MGGEAGSCGARQICFCVAALAPAALWLSQGLPLPGLWLSWRHGTRHSHSHPPPFCPRAPSLSFSFSAASSNASSSYRGCGPHSRASPVMMMTAEAPSVIRPRPEPAVALASSLCPCPHHRRHMRWARRARRWALGISRPRCTRVVEAFQPQWCRPAWGTPALSGVERVGLLLGFVYFAGTLGPREPPLTP